ncbi:MAG: T9SS type A sorting domain-containing protein [bacterium]|nr:T9SS type A sorting domain-containing protein [bacterium]
MSKKLNLMIGILFIILTVQSALAQVEVTDTVLLNPAVGAGKCPVAVDADITTNRIYIANMGSNNVSVIDGTVDTLMASITVGDTPVAICVNSITKRIYVANKGNNTISVIDGTSNTVINTIPIDTICSDYNYTYVQTYIQRCMDINSKTNKIYVTSSKGKISVIDGASNTIIDTIQTSKETNKICVNDSTNLIYAADYQKVSIIDGSSDTLIDTIPLTSPIFDICVNPLTNKIHVAAGNLVGLVFIIDGATNKLVDTTYNLGFEAHNICVNPLTNRIYVTGEEFYKCGITVIDGTVDTVIETLRTAFISYDIYANPLTNKIYVANGSWDDIVVLDGTEDTITATIRVSEHPSALCVNPITNKIYTGNSLSNDIKVIEGVSNSVVATIPTGYYFNDIDVNPLTNKIYAGYGHFFALKGERDITTYYAMLEIDGASNTVVDTIPYICFYLCVSPAMGRVYNASLRMVFPNPWSGVLVMEDSGNTFIDTIKTMGEMSVNPVTHKLYIYNSYIYVMDEISNEIIDTIKNVGGGMGLFTGFIDVNYITNKIYAVDVWEGKVSVVNGNDNTIIKKITIGDSLSGICVNSTINRIYVACRGDNSVSVIDGTCDSLIQIVKLGIKPTSIAVNPATKCIYVTCDETGEVLVLKDNTGVEENSNIKNQNPKLEVGKNPFIKSTLISCQIPAKSKVSLKLYDLSGRCVKTLVNGEKEEGNYNINLNAKDLKTGIYFIKLSAGKYKETKKLILMK